MHDDSTVGPMQVIWGLAVAAVVMLAVACFNALAQYTMEHGPNTCLIVVGGGVVLALLGWWARKDALREEKNPRRRWEVARDVWWANFVIALGIGIALYGLAAWGIALNAARALAAR